MKKRISRAIQEGLAYIATEQESDGSFKSYLSLDPDIPNKENAVRTVFIPAIMLAALATCKTSESLNIRQKLADFLLSQKSPQWTFNFWAHDEPLKKTRNYPDDLDDTFCVYIALYAHNPSLVTPEVLAHMTKVLVSTEKTPGGPYRTWLVPANSEAIWTDVDIAVNSNIAYFLTKVSRPPAGLHAYLEQSIISGQISSPYYPPNYPILYYLARAYTGNASDRLLQLIRRHHKTHRLSLMERALMCTAVMTITKRAQEIHKDIQIILKAQKPDGSWPARSFCTDQYTEAGVYQNGCAALTTALVLEALATYQNLIHAPRTPKNHVSTTKDTLTNNVSAFVQKSCSKLNQPLKDSTLLATSHILTSTNAQEVTHFASNFNSSLKNPLRNQSTLLVKLGAANVFGWTAYTIYDDFLDNEGKAQLLPAANTSLRLAYELFLDALPNQTFKNFVRESFNKIDNANTWELTHCRFDTYNKRTVTIEKVPDYGNLEPLAHRSVGHAISPLAVLVKSGTPPESADFQAIFTAIQHYIIARQLNDDLHDWQKDFLHGHISYIVATLLKEFALTPGTYRFHELLPSMQKHFWYYTLKTIYNDILQHIELSRKALQKSSVLKRDNVIENLLYKIEESAYETLDKQSQTIEFLKHF